MVNIALFGRPPHSEARRPREKVMRTIWLPVTATDALVLSVATVTCGLINI